MCIFSKIYWLIFPNAIFWNEWIILWPTIAYTAAGMFRNIQRHARTKRTFSSSRRLLTFKNFLESFCNHRCNESTRRFGMIWIHVHRFLQQFSQGLVPYWSLLCSWLFPPLRLRQCFFSNAKKIQHNDDLNDVKTTEISL